MATGRESVLGLLAGDIYLSSFEAKLSEAWPRCVDRHPPSFRATTAFHRVIRQAARKWTADVALIDVGPNLGALNRAALIAAQYIVVPLGADLFSIQGLRNLGPTLAAWREQWKERVSRCPLPDLDLPDGSARRIDDAYRLRRHAAQSLRRQGHASL